MTKRKNGLYSIILGVWALCILFAVPMPVSAEEEEKTPTTVTTTTTGSCGEGTTYVLEEVRKVEETGETGVLISATLTVSGNGAIDEFAFANKDITEVGIKTGVTSIGDNAFRQNSSLTSITIPASVKSIGLSAFYS